MLHGGFRPPAVGNVFDGEKNQVWVRGLRREPAGVEQHVPSPESDEGVFNLEVFNRMAVAQDLGEERAQSGDVPLPVAQVVDELALRLFFRDMEVPVESGVGRADPQASVENHERLSQGRNDILSVGKGEFQLMCMLVTVPFHLAPHLQQLSKLFLPYKC